MVALKAIGWCAAIAVMFGAVSLMPRFDSYMRKIGLGALMTGGPTFALLFSRIIRIVLVVPGVYGLIRILRNNVGGQVLQ
jgi:hypothetical protein